MKITLGPTGVNNFHNRPAVTVVVGAGTLDEFSGRTEYPISARTARRIERHFCDSPECHCPHGGVVEDISGEGEYVVSI